MTTRHDVIVLGTGAAGLTAAVTAAEEGADVAVYEKSELIGGTTAMSGGIVWIPGNDHMADAGLEDSREDALAYLASLSLGQIDSDMAATFVDTGPEAVRFVETETPVRFGIIPGYPDYHPEHPGGRPGGGRSLDPELFSFAELGDWAARIRSRSDAAPMTLRETPLGGATESPPAEVLAERVTRNDAGLGLALIGGLLRACLDRGIEPRTGTAAESLVLDEVGAVCGVRLAGGEVVGSSAVLIATGGFEWNEELVRTFLRGPMTAPAGSPASTGDGLVMAMDVGARLGNMRNAWWVPVARVPGEEAWGRPRVRLILLERTRPGSLMVNGDAVRFCNEAGNYNAMGGVFHEFDPARFSYPNTPSWLIFDHAYFERYDVCGRRPGGETPGWMSSAGSIAELAMELDLDPGTLVATVGRFNEHAVRGEDPDFGRGESAYDRFNGDQRLPGVQATLGPVATPPFHAIRIESGSLGTNGGPKTDTRCRVLRNTGGIIPGLYAAGNAMAAPTGMVYGGAGGTLGPALTFGYIAGLAAAAHARA